MGAGSRLALHGQEFYTNCDAGEHGIMMYCTWCLVWVGWVKMDCIWHLEVECCRCA
jgi:hypothetical protein